MQTDKSPAFLMIVEALTHLNGALRAGKEEMIKDVLREFPDFTKQLMHVCSDVYSERFTCE